MANSKKKKKTKTKKRTAKNNLTYDDIEDIVEYLVRTKSYNYSFDCFEPADIAQEIRIICLKALKHFDVTRVDKDKWQNFFGRCVDNGLKNLKRDKYLRTSSPCRSDCQWLHGDEHMHSNLGSVCKKWIKFRKALQRKISIKHPVPIDVVGDIEQGKSFQKEIETKEFKSKLYKLVSEDLRPALDIMLNGNSRRVPKKIREQIKEEVFEYVTTYIED